MPYDYKDTHLTPDENGRMIIDVSWLPEDTLFHSVKDGWYGKIIKIDGKACVKIAANRVNLSAEHTILPLHPNGSVMNIMCIDRVEAPKTDETAGRVAHIHAEPYGGLALTAVAYNNSSAPIISTDDVAVLSGKNVLPAIGADVSAGLLDIIMSLIAIAANEDWPSLAIDIDPSIALGGAAAGLENTQMQIGPLPITIRQARETDTDRPSVLRRDAARATVQAMKQQLDRTKKEGSL